MVPQNAGLVHRTILKTLSACLYFFFTVIPYAPIRRVNQPARASVSGRVFWAGTHHNYLCDICATGWEGIVPPRYVAKYSLFRFPFKAFMNYCGAIPVVRPHDDGKVVDKSLNRKAFSAVVESIRQGWSICIFPEGTSIPMHGLILPLRVGVVKMALAAEEDADFQLGVRIQPVGMEYGSRTEIASGLIIRYGKPILVAEYREQYASDSTKTIKALMDRLLLEMRSIFPDFLSWEEFNLGEELVRAGIMPNNLEAARYFRDSPLESKDSFLMAFAAFKKSCKAAGLSLEACKHFDTWSAMDSKGRLLSWLLLVAGLPFYFWYLIHNWIADKALYRAACMLSADETEFMSIRVLLTPVVVGVIYWLQWRFLPSFVPRWGFFYYAMVCIMDWYFVQQWAHIMRKMWFVWRLTFSSDKTELLSQLQNLKKSAQGISEGSSVGLA